MDVYLFDTNAVSPLFDALDPKHKDILSFVKSLGEDIILISCITIGEIEYGLKVYSKIDQERCATVRNELKIFKQVIGIDWHTTIPFSDIRAALFKKFGKKDKRNEVETKWPEDLIDKTTGKELGVQENDIWIASLAVQYNAILVTGDKMTRIKEVEPRLRFCKWK